MYLRELQVTFSVSSLTNVRANLDMWLFLGSQIQILLTSIVKQNTAYGYLKDLADETT